MLVAASDIKIVNPVHLRKETKLAIDSTIKNLTIALLSESICK